ncbi:MAG: hypothetical protein KGJ78_07350 [Alphaproteobacteria bacterium]|nr:hypothetical protein [Alphaproteobacteria bacterium]
MPNKLFLMAVIAAGLTGAAFTADAPKADCHLREVASLVLTTLPDGRITVPVTINGQQVQLVVSTDDDFSMLTNSDTVKLNLALHHYNNWSLRYTDQVTVGIGRIPPFQMRFNPMEDTPAPAGAAGTLAMDFFRNFDVEIDVRHGALNLFSPDHCPNQVVYWSSGPYARVKLQNFQGVLFKKTIPAFTAALDGQPVLTIIDTYAKSSTMNIDFARRTFGNSDETFVPTLVSGPDVALAHDVYSYPFKNLGFGGVSVQNPKILITTDGWALRLGMDILRQLHIYIAMREGYLYVTSADAR